MTPTYSPRNVPLATARLVNRPSLANGLTLTSEVWMARPTLSPGPNVHTVHHSNPSNLTV